MLTVQRWFSEKPVDPSRSGSTSRPTSEAPLVSAAGNNLILQNQGNSFQGRLGNTKGLRLFNVKMKVKIKEQGPFSDRPHPCLSGIGPLV
jgi:hypothetical protein